MFFIQCGQMPLFKGNTNTNAYFTFFLFHLFSCRHFKSVFYRPQRDRVVNFTRNKLKQTCVSSKDSKDSSKCTSQTLCNLFIFLKEFWFKLQTFDLCCLANWSILEGKLCAVGGRALSDLKALENYNNQSNQSETEGGGRQERDYFKKRECAREYEGTKSRRQKLQTLSKGREKVADYMACYD